ncbi:MAG: hypothetical protein AB2L14_21845 [Candidatus Xenobiia bacterium LiM19]
MIEKLPSLPDGSTTGVRGNRRVPKEDQGKSDTATATDTFIPSKEDMNKDPLMPVCKYPVSSGKTSARAGMSQSVSSLSRTDAGKPVDAEELYQFFLKGEEGMNPEHLAYLDKGIDQSPYREEIPSYPSRLAATPQTVHDTAPLYPALGRIPDINEKALDFLHSDILNACVCIGTYADGRMHARWLGRNAKEPVQMWSSTKIIPMTRTAIKTCENSPGTRLENCIASDGAIIARKFPEGKVITDTGVNTHITIPPESECPVKVEDGAGRPGGSDDKSNSPITLPAAFDAIVSYRMGSTMSNSLARMCKQFDTPDGMESWLHGISGNHSTEFRGGYGAAPYFSCPRLTDKSTGKTVLKASGADHQGNNFVSAYDISRVMSMIAWNARMGPEAAIPHINQSSVDTLVRALGTDSARFVDVALDAMGLKGRIRDPVIISKLGFGLSDIRKQYEEVYSAYVQFTDSSTGKPYQVAMTLRGGKPPESPGAAMELDARMATQVALIIQRLMDGTL